MTSVVSLNIKWQKRPRRRFSIQWQAFWRLDFVVNKKII